MKQSQTLHLYGNWKMNPETLGQVTDLLKDILLLNKKVSGSVHIALAVPSVFCDRVVKLSKDILDIGVQNIHSEANGAHTGDVSISQVQSVGARFTLVGHSERRALGETNEDINKKIVASTKAKLGVVLCIGETVRDDHGDYLKEIKHQLVTALWGLDKKYMKYVTIAYEPVWAIGAHATGVATPVECLEVVISLRRTLRDIYGENVSKNIVILYGGSANAENANGFLIDGGVQGFLLGRASLSIDELTKLSKL